MGALPVLLGVPSRVRIAQALSACSDAPTGDYAEMHAFSTLTRTLVRAALADVSAVC